MILKKNYLLSFLTIGLTIVIFARFGMTCRACAITILLWGLLVLSYVDIIHQLLPDSVTLPLIWLGLIVNEFALFVPTAAAINGLCLGYFGLWSVAILYKFFRGIDGIGNGDLKLFAMWGAWLGPDALILIMGIAACSASVVGGIRVCCKKQEKNRPMPFGPYLAFAGLIVLCWFYPQPIG